MKKKTKTKSKKSPAAKVVKLPEKGMLEVLRRCAGLPPSLGHPIADSVAAEVQRQIHASEKLKVSEFCVHDASLAANFAAQMEHKIRHATNFIGKRVVGVTVDKVPQSPDGTLFSINLVLERP